MPEKEEEKEEEEVVQALRGRAATNPLTARARARIVSDGAEDFNTYYCQEAAHRQGPRRPVNVGAFHETEDWRHGKKVLSALGAMAVPEGCPRSWRMIDLLREVEALLEDP